MNKWNEAADRLAKNSRYSRGPKRAIELPAPPVVKPNLDDFKRFMACKATTGAARRLLGHSGTEIVVVQRGIPGDFEAVIWDCEGFKLSQQQAGAAPVTFGVTLEDAVSLIERLWSHGPGACIVKMIHDALDSIASPALSEVSAAA